MVNALLAEELAKRHEVTVLTSRGLGTPAQSDDNGVRVVRVPVFFRRQQAAANFASMLAYLAMGRRGGRSLLRHSRFDVINTHFVLPSGPVGHALASTAGLPNVLSIHGGDVFDPSKWMSPHRHALLRAWVRRLLRSADLVVGQSRNTLENMHRYYAPEIEGVRIPLGIKRPHVRSASRQRYGYSERELLLVTVGRLVRRKALDQLIDMMAKINEPNVHLLVLGTGGLENSLREQAQRLAIAERVRFFGFVSEDQKLSMLAMSDLFVSTTQHEGFGLVFLEAMACGLPVVCYDHGGQTDFLEDGKTGYVVSLNDQMAFKEHCRRLIGESSRRKAMAEENRDRVQEYFIDRCADRYEQVFERVIAGHCKRS